MKTCLQAESTFETNCGWRN